ncbi:MAG TPA: TIR domain-containing protein [Pyrinomonadaceae bacterium]|nr:TIR domain-containing protein [Pyrinomonadaceae bacterium]
MKEKHSIEWEMGTVVFIDVVSSTSLVASEPDMETLLFSMEMAAKSAKAKGGNVIKILGDRLISIFSTPAQALDFAVGIHDKFRDFKIKFNQLRNNRLRVGVATGELAVVESDVFGSAINIASRLVQRAEVGQTLCDEATATLAGKSGEIQKTLEGRWTLKGFSGRLQIYSLSSSIGSNETHIEILKQGVASWNHWREKNFTVEPNLTGADLSGFMLVGADLRKTTLAKASLSEANLGEVNLSRANLTGANLSKSNLVDAIFTGAVLRNADLSEAVIGRTTFSNNDLSTVKGLKTVRHIGPSNISIDSLYKSGGKIPDAFLIGCGLPDSIISNLPALISSQQPIQFYSCFISYSHKDEEFARHLYARLRDAHIRVWFAPEEIRGGEKLYEQIDRAIQIHDRLLVILSNSSLQSKWMFDEIRRARQVEIKQKQRKVFPIRLVDMDTILEWECFDPDSGKDLAVEIREYFIPDFSNWKDPEAFEAAFDRLFKSLKAAETTD